MLDLSTQRTGNGSEDLPFHSADGTAGIQAQINGIASRGGRVFLPCARYNIDKTIEVNTSCLFLDGEAWNYSSDPNGVFESAFGTKLRMNENNFPMLSIGDSNTLGGVSVQNIGFQGNIVGMDTRGLWNTNAPSQNAGLYIGATRIDQCEFAKLSFCGLASGISAYGEAEIDACRFERFNADGCCIGVYFSPRASFYSNFQKAVIADTPSYGFFADGSKERRILELTISEISFIRNGGFMHEGHLESAAAVHLKNVRSATIRDCLVDLPGVFWYYPDDATHNEQRQIHQNKAVGIRVTGNNCRILGNIIKNTSCESIVVKGDNNILSGNIVESDIVIEGNGNTLSNIIFTKESARLILKGSAITTSSIISVQEERILRKEN